MRQDTTRRKRLHNRGFNPIEFEGIKNEAGRNSFFLSAKKWIDLTGAKGLIASAGRYGGTYARKDIAFEFGSWLSPEFKLYLIKESQRLKDEENDCLKLDWNVHRTLAKINYCIVNVNPLPILKQLYSFDQSLVLVINKRVSTDPKRRCEGKHRLLESIKY